MTPAGFPHSDTPGSTLGCQLPRAYRRLLRPSSALDAKASTMCPSQLVTNTTNPCPPPPHHNHRQKRPHPPPPKTKRASGAPNLYLYRADDDPGRQCTQHTTKMLASTIQISNNNPTPRTTPTLTGEHNPGPGPTTPTPLTREKPATLKKQPPHPTTEPDPAT